MVKAGLTQLERTVIDIHAVLGKNIADSAVITHIKPAAFYRFNQSVGFHSDSKCERPHILRYCLERNPCCADIIGCYREMLCVIVPGSASTSRFLG